MFTQHDFLYLLLLMLSKIITFKRFQQRHQTDRLSHRARVIELGVLWLPLPVESFAPCSSVKHPYSRQIFVHVTVYTFAHYQKE